MKTYGVTCYDCGVEHVCDCFEPPRTKWSEQLSAQESAVVFHRWYKMYGNFYCPNCDAEGPRK